MTEGIPRPADAGPSDSDPAASFDALFRREFPPITRTAYLVVGDWEVARELAQDAFVQALRHWDKVRTLESPGGWVRRVAIRDAVRARARDSRRRELHLGAGTAADAAPTTSVDVRDALMTLPARQRAVVALHYLDDRPVAEIAELLGCSSGTVKTHLARARQALAARLGEDLDDELR
jgi:RNA polymerase sigma-70 factor (ECF subfamily)